MTVITCSSRLLDPAVDVLPVDGAEHFRMVCTHVLLDRLNDRVGRSPGGRYSRIRTGSAAPS
jgi:hypothetical protein